MKTQRWRGFKRSRRNKTSTCEQGTEYGRWGKSQNHVLSGKRWEGGRKRRKQTALFRDGRPSTMNFCQEYQSVMIAGISLPLSWTPFTAHGPSIRSAQRARPWRLRAEEWLAYRPGKVFTKIILSNLRKLNLRGPAILEIIHFNKGPVFSNTEEQTKVLLISSEQETQVK